MNEDSHRIVFDFFNKNGIKKKQRVAFDFKKNGYDLK
jgi:hypothetical protein